MVDLKTQNAELIEQINSLQKAYGRMVDENAEEKRELRTQLAKANERVKELEDTVHLLEKDLLRQSVFMINTAAKLEQHREWQATANVLRRPTREANEALNKFAIEQQVRALDKFYCLVVTSGEPVTTQSVRNYIEQLRKEQE